MLQIFWAFGIDALCSGYVFTFHLVLLFSVVTSFFLSSVLLSQVLGFMVLILTILPSPSLKILHF
ncbi:hypothetical protein CPB83DRAFT_861090 [Crepidotus variabilis]|uniref:Uncharacterized protein n=1 Tax=Crepidotus variabilis TaxID=179855 RepID=A0A9P6JLA1_9AGAR|nr:hypothetical protein CPB83DRAFT_861090 [Crepidotus variabilis]